MRLTFSFGCSSTSFYVIKQILRPPVGPCNCAVWEIGADKMFVHHMGLEQDFGLKREQNKLTCTFLWTETLLLLRRNVNNSHILSVIATASCSVYTIYHSLYVFPLRFFPLQLLPPHSSRSSSHIHNLRAAEPETVATWVLLFFVAFLFLILQLDSLTHSLTNFMLPHSHPTFALCLHTSPVLLWQLFFLFLGALKRKGKKRLWSKAEQ